METSGFETGYSFLKGGGEMGELTRTHNWSQTPIGTPAAWSQSLRTTIGIVLHSAFPMALFWGQDHISFYNDAFQTSFSQEGKPSALAKAGKEGWSEIWDHIGPLIDKVTATGEPVWYEDQMVPFYRGGNINNIYWTISYSPVYGDNDQVMGVLVTCNETTEKVKTIQQLQEVNDKLAFAIEATELGAWDLNPATNTFSANDRLKEWFGLTAEEDSILPLATSAVAERDRKRVDEAIKQALQYDSGGQYDIDYTLIHPITKEERVVRAKGKAWFNDEKIAYRFNGTLQDITDRKKVEQALAESEQALRSIVESAPFPIGVYVGPEMVIQFANSSIINVWGKGPEVIGKRYADILPELANQGIYGQLDQVYKTGISFHAKYQRVDIVVDDKLQPYYFNYSFTPLYDVNGRIYGVMNTAAEVTDLVLAKQQVDDAEKALRGAIDLAELATWSMDIETRQFHYSERFMDWLGFNEDIKNQDEAYDSLPDGYRQQVADALDAVVQPGSSGFYENEYPIVNRVTGQVRIIHAQAQIFFDAVGKPVMLSGTAQDITQQRELQIALEQQVQERTEELEATNEEMEATNEELMATNEELAEANQLLMQSNENLNQFAYIASHDLQEPLRKIQSFGDILKTRYAEQLGDGVDHLQRMQSAASRMSALIKDLLTFSRINIQQSAVTSVSLDEVMRMVMTDLELIINDTNAQIEIGPLPTVNGDASQLGQLFQNLLSNALKFHRPNVSPSIQISSEQIPARNLPPNVIPTYKTKFYHRIDVADNGIGFDEKYLSRIFQVFQRLHGKNEFVGTGVGLAICQKVALNHGGAITATSTLGQGSTFIVYLPVDRMIL